jgi:A/G-specific adenine glycosylase
MHNFFTVNLLQWHNQHNTRQMPWKGVKDAYKIWLSEIILQQTKVEQGLSYYNKFIQHYPTITHLAKANEEEVFKLWEGLGYYSRCKNLLITAKQIAEKYHGIFPKTYSEIISLKGVGPYTAAAIASFAYNLPFAVLDGNVYRVLSRFFNNSMAIDSNNGKKAFQQLANKVIDTNQPALYNQAIMDFGATVCKPINPACDSCILQKKCAAFKANTVNSLPVKEKKLIKKTRYFYYYIVEYNNSVFIEKRVGKDIWENLHQFYLVELATPITLTTNKIEKLVLQKFNAKCSSIIISNTHKQQLTHQTIIGKFITVKLNTKPTGILENNFVPKQSINSLAFPKFINGFLSEV